MVRTLLVLAAVVAAEFVLLSNADVTARDTTIAILVGLAVVLAVAANRFLNFLTRPTWPPQNSWERFFARRHARIAEAEHRKYALED
ncbi:hypothetical protein ABN028_19360 [Actinopolymorpha sp. B17G11]|uniref:hypothetical protein n=1 Tax=Actinopolymorpha sp. B17G11 TaxID=3160861 RepID=UPI0032E3EFE1